MVGFRTGLVAALLVLLAGCGEKDTEGDRGAAADKESGALALREKGQSHFEAACLPCHCPAEGYPGTVALIASRGAEFADLARRDDLTSDYIRQVVRMGQGAMPPYRKADLMAEELDAIAAYLAAE